MKVEIDLPEWVIDAIKRGPPPWVECGPDLAERIGYICQNWADSVIGGEDEDKRNALYRAFGVRHRLDDGDDDIAL